MQAHRRGQSQLFHTLSRPDRKTATPCHRQLSVSVVEEGPQPGETPAQGCREGQGSEGPVAQHPEPADKVDLRLGAQITPYFRYKEDVAKNRSSTLYVQRKSFDAHILPRFGDVKINKLDPMEVSRFLGEIARERPGTANTLYALLSAFMAWAVLDPDLRQEGVQYNFMRDLQRPVKQHQRSRILEDNEIRALFNVLPELGTFGDVVEMLLRTGLRRAEITGLKWDQVMLEDGQIVFTPHMTKTKAHMVVPLTGKTRAIIERQPGPRTGYVFTNRLGNAFSSNSHFDRKLWNRSGIEGAVIHDLRRTMRTNLSRIGVKEEVAEACLGHKRMGIVGTYNRFDHYPKKQTALMLWDDFLDEIIKKDTKSEEGNLETPT